jgi:hypothetical protein
VCALISLKSRNAKNYQYFESLEKLESRHGETAVEAAVKTVNVTCFMIGWLINSRGI